MVRSLKIHWKISKIGVSVSKICGKTTTSQKTQEKEVKVHSQWWFVVLVGWLVLVLVVVLVLVLVLVLVGWLVGWLWCVGWCWLVGWL